jgi:hypothetical protein
MKPLTASVVSLIVAVICFALAVLLTAKVLTGFGTINFEALGLFFGFLSFLLP